MMDIDCNKIGEDIVLAVMLAHKSDKESVFHPLPTDVIFQILKRFIPDSQGKYLLPKPLSRSYYRICRRIVYTEQEDWEVRFNMSQDVLSKFSSNLDLVSTSVYVLSFLHKVNKSINFRSYAKKEMNTLFDNYILFLLLQARNPDLTLIPSLEIQAIWFTHMLQSGVYETFVSRVKTFIAAGRIHNLPSIKKCDLFNVPHIATLNLSQKDYDEYFNSTQKLFKNEYGEYPYQYNKIYKFKELQTLLLKDYRPDMAADDQLWLLEFQKFTRGTDYRSLSFREKAHIGYQRMLYLKWKISHEMEEVGFSPCPSIDLIWHTHLLHPYTYRQDMFILLGNAPKHKLLNPQDRTLVFMNNRDDKQEYMWRNYFKESLFTYAVV